MQKGTAMHRDLSLGVGPAAAFALPSRRAALDAGLAALAGGGGPVLVTGEPGVGKTWLAIRLIAEAPGLAGWVGLDLTPATRPNAAIRATLHALGLAADGPGAGLRTTLADVLVEQA